MTKARKSNRSSNVARASSKTSLKGSNSRCGKSKSSQGKREKEIEAWWSINSLRSHGGKGGGSMLGLLLGGASTVAKAFMEHYKPSFDLEKTAAILVAYRQFLAVKQDQQDWEGEVLGPCCLVSAMWEMHSQLPNYESDMQLVFGRPVQYGGRPRLLVAEGDCVLALETRMQATIQAIGKMFGKRRVDGSVWNVIFIGVYRLDDRLDGENDRIPCFFLDKTKPLTDMLQEWAEDEEVSVDDFEFFYKRKRIDVGDTPETLGMSVEDDVDALPRDHLWIVVRDARGEEIIYQLLASDMLWHLMKSYAEDAAVERSSLVFVFRGKMVFAHENARYHNLSNYDVIEAIPASSYKHGRCACCNPATQKDLFTIAG